MRVKSFFKKVREKKPLDERPFDEGFAEAGEATRVNTIVSRSTGGPSIDLAVTGHQRLHTSLLVDGYHPRVRGHASRTCD